MPGVSEESISLSAWSALRRSSSLSKKRITTAVDWAPSTTTWIEWGDAGWRPLAAFDLAGGVLDPLAVDVGEPDYTCVHLRSFSLVGRSYSAHRARTAMTRAILRRAIATSQREPLLPTRVEAGELIPPRGGITWRIAGDARLFAASGYALLLQVSHPSVGAGVSAALRTSSRSPWGRLLRTLDYTSSMVYGGPDLAWEVGRRVREMHRRIEGVRPDGVPYHALDPAPYAWVHATLAESIVRGHRLFCSTGLPASGRDGCFWVEWRRMGRLDRRARRATCPGPGPACSATSTRWSTGELEDTEAAQDVIGSLPRPAAPPLPWMRDGVWRLLRWPYTRAGSLATLGMLPPVLRGRLGVRWSATQGAPLPSAGPDLERPPVR